MTSRTTPFVLAMVVASTAATAVAQSPAARVRVTQRALQVLCVGDDATRPGTRAWRTPTATPVTLAVTMRNDPRPGVADAEPPHVIVDGERPVVGDVLISKRAASTVSDP